MLSSADISIRKGVCIDMVTVILSPMNPWIESDVIQERLLKYWESKPIQSVENTEQGRGQRPFQTLSIEIACQMQNRLSTTRN